MRNESYGRLSKEEISKLFDHDRSVISRHISNIFKEKELDENSNVHFLHIPLSDKPVPFYTLDVIISVGYRVQSDRGILFRRWANKVLKDFDSLPTKLSDYEKTVLIKKRFL